MRVFGTLIVVLLAFLVIATMMLSGMLPSIFGNEFSKKITYAQEGDTPCPTERARPVPAEGTQIQVLNASSLSGTASKTSKTLKKLGYEIALVDNAQTPFRGNIQIDAGPADVDAAYTLARYFHEPVRIKLRTLPAGMVNLTIGEGFRGILPKAERKEIQESDSRLVGLNECLPVNTDEILSFEQSGDDPQSEDAQSE